MVKKMKSRIVGILGALLSAVGGCDSAEPEKHDVVVYGGTSAGVAAAVQVSRMGKTVVLIEPGAHLGGLSSGGLGFTDTGRTDTVGGISREFYQRAKKYYDRREAWTRETAEEYNRDQGRERYDKEADAIWVFEPHVAEAIFDDWVKEKGITVVRGERLNRESGVRKEGNRIVSIMMESGRVFAGKMFIDAGYEGDLLAAAGVTYHVGRESNAQYGENFNGVHRGKSLHKMFVVDVDPYVEKGKPESGLVWGIVKEPTGENGSGDQRVQAYCFRMCLSNDPDNRTAFPRPENYDESKYELLFRNFEAGDMNLPLGNAMIPNRKTDTNSSRGLSTDAAGMNYAYPEASYDERDQIVQYHIDYQQGLLWTLANHPRVPGVIREQMSGWGLAADEFADSGHWPHQLYIREARRMVSDHVMTEADCFRRRVAEDSVGLGSYALDSHSCGRYVTESAKVQGEGNVFASSGGPYVISYRSIVPKKAECENLLTPTCVASSHIAFGSIRMEPVFMILAQSAATAAVMAMDSGSDVQDVPYEKLRKRLEADGQRLDLPKGWKPKIVVPLATIDGVVVDDERAEYVGEWKVSAASMGFVADGYHHDQKRGDGKMTATFSADLDSTGEYEVSIAYPAGGGRATNVPVMIYHQEGESEMTVNQKVNKGDEQGFVLLGTFTLSKGIAKVVISNTGTNGHVIVDAVKWIKK